MSFTATYYGGNSWLIQIEQKRILIDPWLRGPLTFSPGSWLLKGEMKTYLPIPEKIDLILLTQGLPDHTHLESLKLFPAETRVICPRTSLNTLEKTNLNNLKVVSPKDSFKYGEIYFKVTSGANVPTQENGYILRGKEDSIYIEPHGFLDNQIKPEPIDALITPIVDIKIPLLGSFIKGNTIIYDLINTFNPKVILASTTGGDIKFSGVLSKVFNQEGSVDLLKKLLPSNISIIEPKLGKDNIIDTRVNLQ